MCGIAGTLSFTSLPIDGPALRRAADALRHRGPDDSGDWIDAQALPAIGLAAVRLAVIDPTPAGHQPMLIGDERYVLVYNGELYNCAGLRAELAAAGWSFRTQTDTEVVAAACAHWGPDALARFNGMFALAFFDRRERNGFLARDRYGIKPLLLARDGNSVHFASEMKALRCLGRWTRQIDQAALRRYLHLGYFGSPSTIYAQARRVPPGSYHRFDAAGLHEAVAYAPEPTPVDPTADYSAACGRLRSALADSVARRRVADVPLGAFLSGGIDSSIIAAHLAECTSGRVRTFAIGFREHARYDETRFAQLMADHLGSEHHELRLGFADVISALPEILDHLGEPFADSSIIPTALVSRLARAHVTVCLSGDGGDELFGGYWRYFGHQAAGNLARLPGWIRTRGLEPLLACLSASKSSALGNRVRQLRKLLREVGDSPIRRHLRWSMIVDARSAGILRDAGATGSLLRELEEDYARLVGNSALDDPLNGILRFDLRTSLSGDMLHKVDLASMMHSLEVRVPFLDPEVVSAAERCPMRFKIDRGLRKRMLVDAYRGRLPDAILERQKMGFELPVGEFLRDAWRELFLDSVTRDRIESLEVLDFGGVMRVYADHCARRGEYADLLFALLSLCWWRERGG